MRKTTHLSDEPKKKGDTLLYMQEPKKEGEEGRENKKRGCCRCFLKAVSVF